MSDPKERLWEEAINRQLDTARDDGCLLSTSEWIIIIILCLVFAVLIWNVM